jgi:hypothetical protein
MINYLKTLFIFSLLMFGCNATLEEDVFDEVASNNFFQSDSDAITAVNSVYARMRGVGNSQWGLFVFGNESLFNYSELITDEVFTTWSLSFPSGPFGVLENFNFIPNSGAGLFWFFRDFYDGINLTNVVIENVRDNPKISQEIQDRVIGEALFGRGLFYTHLLSLYGNIPLVLTTNTDPFSLPTQAPHEDVVASIIDDLTAASKLLPDSYGNSDYGRFTKGAALALLARFYLNQKMWTQAEQTSRAVIGSYSLSNDYADIFAVDNSNNPEIILVLPCINQANLGNTFLASTAEPNYVASSWGGTRIRQAFYNSFDPADTRRNLLAKEYVNFSGSVTAINNGAMIMKYAIDEAHNGPWAGNDIVLHRYSEVLLTLTEALNELNGPNQESIDLINQLRDRAFEGDASKLLSLSNFSSKDQLRDHILDERGWELYAEGYRREDLIRHNKLIQKAQERGLPAQDFHVLYPIHQSEIDRNPSLMQNPGYQ